MTATTNRDRVQAAVSDDSARGGNQKGAPLISILCSPVFHCLLLVSLVAACFARTITSGYFVADDPAQVAYVSRAVTTNPELFLQNMLGNYMGVPGMAVWRPVLFISLVVDFVVWKTNATGYFLTNFAYFCASVVLLYAIVRLATASWPVPRSSAAALLAPALFAASPLRCESVSWVVGRVDIICGFFYLLALYMTMRLFLKPPSSKKVQHVILSVSLVAYAAALLTKEMAIGLPLLVTALAVLLPGSRLERKAVVASFWTLTVCYFAMRYLALGTLIGGYASEHGASSLSNLVTRWTDWDTITRLFFPLVHDIFTDKPVFKTILAIFYTVIALMAALRFIVSPRLSWRWSLICLTWLASAAIPIFQLWGLGYNLESSRFYWFLSFPLSIIVPSVLLAPLGDPHNPALRPVDRRLSMVSAFILCLFLLVMTKVTYMTNLLWVHAGQEVRRFASACTSLAQASGPAEKTVIFGVPRDNAGAHLILNMHMFNCLMSPPFTRTVLADKFVTFEPVLFSPQDHDFIDADRLSASLCSADISGPLAWLRENMGFNAVKLPLPTSSTAAPPIVLPLPIGRSQVHQADHMQVSSTAGGLVLRENRADDGLLFDGLDIDPLRYRFLEITLETDRGGLVRVSWTGLTSLPRSQARLECNTARVHINEIRARQPLRIRIPVAHSKRWFYFERINRLFLQLPGDEIRLRNVRLLPAESVAPVVTLRNGVPLSDSCDNGVQLVKGNTALKLSITNLPKDADELSVEISKTNHFFDNFHEDEKKAILRTDKAGVNSRVEIDTTALKSGYYQVRARTLTAGSPSSEYSEAVTLQVVKQ